MDYQLLYTYSNYNGDVISVEGDFITAYCGDTGGQVIAMLTPLGDKAVALARAILTSAGNTGHEVISSQEIGAKNCPVYETPQELAQEIERLTNERDRLRTAWESARENIAKDMRDRAAHAVAEHGESASPSELYSIVTDLPLVADSDTSEDALGPTHAEGADSLSPCEISTWDVPASLDLGEVECVECLRALARERGRLRTAWESARRGRAQAREQLDDARRYVRILETQRADLRQEVRDTSDQALRATRALPALTERVTQIEKHLGITPESA